MMLTAQHLIAGEAIDSADGRFTAAGALAEFAEASLAHVDRARAAAEEAFQQYRRCSADTRAGFLECIADNIERSPDLLEAAQVETSLPLERLTGERGRTVGQLRMFANLVREG